MKNPRKLNNFRLRIELSLEKRLINRALKSKATVYWKYLSLLEFSIPGFLQDRRALCWKQEWKNDTYWRSRHNHPNMFDGWKSFYVIRIFIFYLCSMSVHIPQCILHRQDFNIMAVLCIWIRIRILSVSHYLAGSGSASWWRKRIRVP